MNRRGLLAIALAACGIVVLAVVAMVAYWAGASDDGGMMRFGRPVREVLPHMGFGGFGGFGWGLGLLLMILLVAGIVWAVLALTRAAAPGPPPVQGPSQQVPHGSTEGHAAPPPAAGSAEAFEAWHRQAHAADSSGATPSAQAPASPEPPPTGSEAPPAPPR